jgi:hypothetical protein
MDDLTLCSWEDGRVIDEEETDGMKIGMIWRIRASMGAQAYDLPDCV